MSSALLNSATPTAPSLSLLTLVKVGGASLRKKSLRSCQVAETGRLWRRMRYLERTGARSSLSPRRGGGGRSSLLLRDLPLASWTEMRSPANS